MRSVTSFWCWPECIYVLVSTSLSYVCGYRYCRQVEEVHAALLILRQLLVHPGAFMKREASGYTKELYWKHVR